VHVQWCLRVSLVLLCWSPGVFAQEGSVLSPPAYQSLRYEEDYGYLRDPARRSDFWDTVKYLSLNDKGDRYLSLGGELRLRYEYFRNANWGRGPQDTRGYFLQRYMVHADLHLNDRIRVFGQLKSALESGRTGGPRPPDEDELDLHQAFIDARMTDALTVRLGRQELAFGSQRLVSVREGPNVRQSFDGGRVIIRAGGWRIDGFFTLPVETDRQVFDDSAERARLFWGVYAVRPFSLLPQANVDGYYLGLDREQARFDQASAHESWHSLGARLWGNPSPWDYNFEFVYQWGHFGRGAISAWTAASDTGYTLHTGRFHPRVGVKANIASGDRRPSGRSLQTFNALFPRGAYFGEIGLIGPANFIDIHPTAEVELSKAVSFSAGWVFFWRQSLRDGIYGNAVNLLRSGRTSRARYIGSQVSLQFEWRLDRHLTLTGVYGHFFAGPFLEQTRPGRDVDYCSTWITYKF
jgi:Alginate export